MHSDKICLADTCLRASGKEAGSRPVIDRLALELYLICVPFMNHKIFNLSAYSISIRQLMLFCLIYYSISGKQRALLTEEACHKKL